MSFKKIAFVVAAGAAISGAFFYGRIKTLLENNSNIVFYSPGRRFYILSSYDWYDYQEDVAELAGILDAIYDEQESSEEIDHFNDLFYKE